MTLRSCLYEYPSICFDEVTMQSFVGNRNEKTKLANLISVLF